MSIFLKADVHQIHLNCYVLFDFWYHSAFILYQQNMLFLLSNLLSDYMSTIFTVVAVDLHVNRHCQIFGRNLLVIY